ncbi:hypothetical protein DAI22_03g300600 [Oryza sativa Japonica Group]|nr:hypothetical protein DAI22_03g300600 [Oryza sativa Japonica Group]
MGRRISRPSPTPRPRVSTWRSPAWPPRPRDRSATGERQRRRRLRARPTPPSLPQSPRLLRIRATARLSRIGRCSREARSPRQITAPSTRIPRLRVAGLHSRRPRSARVAGPHHRRRRPRSPSICTAPDEFNPCTALLECECKNGAAAENTLLRAGYGGWLLYSAASAGDMAFVQELMDRDPLLVFGEGEYGVTDMFYAAARGGNAEVFKLLLDHAMSPRCSTNCPNREGAAAVVAAPRCSGWK